MNELSNMSNSFFCYSVSYAYSIIYAAEKMYNITIELIY
jgi:hypothetical protein